jgi:hypothetical protein
MVTVNRVDRWPLFAVSLPATTPVERSNVRCAYDKQ